MKGYFKVHRKILSSQVFANQTALKVWIWCLAKASYKERYVSIKIGKGEITVKITPGQFLFGRYKAEEELNIDGSTIYRWMTKFSSEEFGMITIKSNNQYSVITICNWDEYQNEDDDKQTTNEQPMSNQRATDEQPTNTNNKDKNSKEGKEKNIEARETIFVSEVWTYNETYSSEMLKKFINYWTEKNKSKTKMKWELEKTFEVSKRLVTWHGREKNINPAPKEKILMMP